MTITYIQKMYLLKVVREKQNSVRTVLSYLSSADETAVDALNDNRKALDALEIDIANTKVEDKPEET